MIVILFLTHHILFFSSDLNRISCTNGLNVPPTKNAPACPPNSGHLMAEKMKLGRLDQGDSDAGKT